MRSIDMLLVAHHVRSDFLAGAREAFQTARMQPASDLLLHLPWKSRKPKGFSNLRSHLLLWVQVSVRSKDICYMALLEVAESFDGKQVTVNSAYCRCKQAQ
jgi:hypothetical protein